MLFSQGCVYEDELPELSNEDFDFLFEFSRVDVVRIYPKIIVDFFRKENDYADFNFMFGDGFCCGVYRQFTET